MTRWEQETIILFNEDEDTASVYTHNKGLMARLDGFVRDFPEYYKVTAEDDRTKTYEIPKKRITIASMTRSLQGKRRTSNFVGETGREVVTETEGE